jgi:hypothetical protein
MGLLDKLGLQRKSRPVGSRLETGFSNPVAERRRDVAGKAAIFLLLTLLTIISFRADESYQFSVRVGDTWTRDDVVAPFPFSIERAEAVIEEEKRRIRYTVPPLFNPVETALQEIDARRDTLRSQLDRIFNAYGSYRTKRDRGRAEEARSDSLRYMGLRRNSLLKATTQQWALLVNAYAARTPGIEATIRTPGVGQRLDIQLLKDAYDAARSLADYGVVDVPLD